MVSYVCPHCHNNLVKNKNILKCSHCALKYPIIENIPIFTQEYILHKGSSTVLGNTKWWKTKRIFIKRFRLINKVIKNKKHLNILDIGCGGGNAFLKNNENFVVGIDLSIKSLRYAQTIYDQVAQAHACSLPFPDNSFDLVVSTDVLGHIPKRNKNTVASEILRVLEPLGETVHYIEAAGNNKLQRFAQRYPGLYKKYFIENDGHFGLEPPKCIVDRFKNYGFVTLKKVGTQSTPLRSLRELLKRFDNEYTEKSLMVGTIISFLKLLSQTRMTRYIAEGIIAIISEIADHFVPFDAADGVFLYLRKTKT
jgi:ubiquinone/menaquinone biosynthesis C-methylase UbiE